MIYLSKRGQSSYQEFLLADLKRKKRIEEEERMIYLSWISNSRSEWKGKKNEFRSKRKMIYLSKRGSIKDLYQQI